MRAAPSRGTTLRPGDPIAVLAPSGVVDARRLERGIAYLERRGHPVIRGRGLAARRGYLAGDDALRAAAFNAVLSRPDAPAIAFARGGYGLTRILDRLDLDRLLRSPRPLLGYSDATALFMALQRNGPYRVHYGPGVTDLADPEAFDEAALWGALYGRKESSRFALKAADVLRHGTGEGTLIGGCLTLLVNLLGTPHDPDYAGSILFWEEVNEPPYRIDRMLTQLRNAGKLERLAGMVIGSLTGCVAPPGKPSLSLRQVVLDRVAPWRFPVVWNLRAGHIAGKMTLPLGVPARLSTSRRVLEIEPDGMPRISAARRGRAASGRSR